MSTTNKASEATILGSLGVKGASGKGGVANAYKIPVIGNDGLLDISLIPVSQIYSTLEIPNLAGTAYVDKHAGSGISGYYPNGSIAAPFRSLTEAAAYNDGTTFSNFILTSDNYASESPVFASTANVIRIFSTGMTTFSALSLSGNHSTFVKFILSNITVQGNLTLGSTQTHCAVSLLGDGSVVKVVGAVSNQAEPDLATWYLDLVNVGPSYSVGSFEYATSVVYTATNDRVRNVSSVVSGTTAKDAMDTLGRRRIRIVKFTYDAQGIHADSEEDVEVADLGSSDSSADYELHDITALGKTLASAANNTFYKQGDSPEFSGITAESIKANRLSGMDVKTTSLRFGSVPVYIDTDDFLTLGDPDSSDSSAYPVVDDGETIFYPV